MEHIALTVEDGIATIRFDRPDSLNAFTDTMEAELIEAFDAVDADGSGALDRQEVPPPSARRPVCRDTTAATLVAVMTRLSASSTSAAPAAASIR